MRLRCTVSFLWFLQNKARKKVVKYMSAWQELHALPTKTFHKFYITSIFCSKTCFSLQAWFFFHHTLYTLNIPITCSHNMVMAHTHLHKFLSICGWTWKLIANRGCFCSAQFMCNIESHFKKKILFHKRWLCSIHKLKG